jgi:hypothetical protein
MCFREGRLVLHFHMAAYENKLRGIAATRNPRSRHAQVGLPLMHHMD